MTTQPIAIDTYLQRLPMLIGNIEALRQLVHDQFGHDPFTNHWSRIGDLERVNQALLSRGRQFIDRSVS